MTVETGSTIFSNTWALLHALVSGNVPDPSARNKKWIFGDFPDIEKSDFPGYPIIIINNPEARVEQLTWTTSSMMDNSTISAITVFGKTQAQIASLSDKIYTTMKDNELLFAQSGHLLQSCSTGVKGTDIVGNQRIHFNEQLIETRLVSN